KRDNAADDLFDGPDGQPLRRDLLHKLLLQRAIGSPQQCPGMAGGDGSFRQGSLRTRRKLEKTEGVGDRRSTFPHPLGDLFMREPEFIDELLIRSRFLQGVEVFAMEVLDQGLLETGDVARIGLNEDRYGLQPGPAGGAPATLSGDELVALVFPVHFAYQGPGR